LIGEPLAGHSIQDVVSALRVIDFQRNAIVIPEIEFGQISSTMDRAQYLKTPLASEMLPPDP
jgi:hypothetical protein